MDNAKGIFTAGKGLQCCNDADAPHRSFTWILDMKLTLVTAAKQVCNICHAST